MVPPIKIAVLVGCALALGTGACGSQGATVNLGGEQPASAAAGASAGGAAGFGGLNVDGSVTTCAPGVTTRLSGFVYDPAGKVPLYNAVVYAPTSAALPPFTHGVQREKCTDPVPARAVALSDSAGHFVLDNVPSGSDVSLVVQVGKWRRLTTIPRIEPCQDNVLTDRDKDLTRLPRAQSEGDIPKIALSTGHSDALECLLRKIGIADSEFTTDAGNGRVNLFVGCISSDGTELPTDQFSAELGGGHFPSTNALFDTNELSDYDALIFSCEGHKCDTIQTPTNIAKLNEYENIGGRVFLDHDHYNWLNHANAPIEKAASFSSGPDVPSPLVTQINTKNFPKGEAFADWLLNVHASATRGELDIYGARTSSTGLDSNRAQSWIYSEPPGPVGFFYFTIGTPVAAEDNTPAPEAWGRVVFTDLHVSAQGVSADFSRETAPFPSGCLSTELSPQEKALEFMLFDLTSCVQKENAMPEPPPPK
ncbi:MAG: carboxypeptidase regulatory-like domain-containing protein [Pseudomonadota bacterium]